VIAHFDGLESFDEQFVELVCDIIVNDNSFRGPDKDNISKN
jgi:hypothetical protein